MGLFHQLDSSQLDQVPCFVPTHWGMIPIMGTIDTIETIADIPLATYSKCLMTHV